MLPNPNLLIQPLIRREAILSSRIEGTRASLGDLYAFEAVQLTLFELPENVKEVQNYVLALQNGGRGKIISPTSNQSGKADFDQAFSYAPCGTIA